jgi:hypothetical protein
MYDSCAADGCTGFTPMSLESREGLALIVSGFEF